MHIEISTFCKSQERRTTRFLKSGLSERGQATTETNSKGYDTRGLGVRVYCGIQVDRLKSVKVCGLPVTDRWGPQVPDLVSSAQAPLSHPSQPFVFPPHIEPLKLSLFRRFTFSSSHFYSVCPRCFSRSDYSTSHVFSEFLRMQRVYQRPRAYKADVNSRTR